MRLIAALLLVVTAVCMAGVKPDKLVAAARSQIGVTVSYDPAYRPLGYPGGDVPKHTGVCTHIGIVSDRQSPNGTPLVIHNIGRGTQEEDILFQFKIIGHYRVSDLQEAAVSK